MSIPDPAALSPLVAFALVGALGVGLQWLAWRLGLLQAVAGADRAGQADGPAT